MSNSEQEKILKIASPKGMLSVFLLNYCLLKMFTFSLRVLINCRFLNIELNDYLVFKQMNSCFLSTRMSSLIEVEDHTSSARNNWKGQKDINNQLSTSSK